MNASDAAVPAGEGDEPCEGGQHCCCCGPGEPCCDCGEIMPDWEAKAQEFAEVALGNAARIGELEIELAHARAALAASPKVASDTAQAEIERLRGLLIDPGTPTWEDARAVLVAELRKAGYSTHADNVEAAHGVLIPSDIALNLIGQASQAKVASDTGAGLRSLDDWLRSEQIDESTSPQNGEDFASWSSGYLTAIDLMRQRVAALATPTDATDGATGGGEVPSSASHDDDEHGDIVTIAYMMGAKDERDRHAKTATTPGGDLLEQAPPTPNKDEAR